MKRRPPITFEVESQPGGFATEFIPDGGTGGVEVVGFHSFDEGLSFVKLLDAFSDYAFRAGTQPSMIDRMLVVLEKERTTVYVNDMIELQGRVRARRHIKAGERVGPADLAGIERLTLVGAQIPDDAGVMLLLSHNWRKAFFYDFRPLNPGPFCKRDYDLEIIAGQLLSHLIFTEYFLLSEQEWKQVTDAGWFPFMFLVGHLWEKLQGAIGAGVGLDDVETEISRDFSRVIDQKLDSWLAKSIFRDDEAFLRRAVRAFGEGDWITVVGLVTPRIEGIIRKSTQSFGSHKNMVKDLEALVTASVPHDRSLLFPRQLANYFHETFLQFVDFANPGDTVNRHTVSHGVANADSITRSHAIRALLLIDHLNYCLP